MLSFRHTASDGNEPLRMREVSFGNDKTCGELPHGHKRLWKSYGCLVHLSTRQRFIESATVMVPFDTHRSIVAHDMVH